MNYIKTLRLSHEEEVRLLRLAKNGDAQAIDTLLHANYMYICKLANKYSLYNSKKVDMQDLVQEGCIGFLKGITKFDSSKIGTVKFISYIQLWVKEYVRAGVRSALNKDRWFRYKMKMINESSLSNKNESSRSLNTIIDRRNLDFNSPEKIMLDREQKEILKTIVKELRNESRDPEKDIIDSFQTDDPIPFSEIGKKHGISRQRIDQRKKIVCQKLQDMMAYHSIG